MSQPVIEVRNLSKRYRIGAAEMQHETFGAQLLEWILQPIRNFSRLKSLTSFSGDGDSENVHWALKGLDFSVNQGEVLGIIGHNGAGKSTLLKILSRITDPTAGEVRIQGRVSSLLEVGTGFHPELTGRDNIYLNGTILGMKKREIDVKFDEIVDFSGVQKYIDTPVKFYSSGMKVRLAFSVAAHLEPDIFIIDEVLAVGDADFQKRCLGKMDEVSKGGRTVLFVSHNMNAIKSICKKALLLKDGKIEIMDEADIVIRSYLAQSNFGGTFYKFQTEGVLDNGMIALNELVMQDSEGKNKKSFPIDRPFLIKISFHKKVVSDVSYIFSLQFKNEKGDILFVTTPNNASILNHQSDNIQLCCDIPANFLNEGNFAINLQVVKKDSKWELLQIFEDILGFTIEPPSHKLGDWMGKSKGWLKPKFDWKLIDG